MSCNQFLPRWNFSDVLSVHNLLKSTLDSIIMLRANGWTSTLHRMKLRLIFVNGQSTWYKHGTKPFLVAIPFERLAINGVLNTCNDRRVFPHFMKFTVSDKWCIRWMWARLKCAAQMNKVNNLTCVNKKYYRCNDDVSDDYKLSCTTIIHVLSR